MAGRLERVELACHTSYDTGQGFSSLNEWIEGVSDLGMSALAVTDIEATEKSFQMICEEAKRARPSIKLNIGIETTVAYYDFCGKVFILIKNKQGIENLRELLCEKDKDEILQFDRVIDKSRGLILGSAGENGLLQSIVDKFDDIDFGIYFDYIEIPDNATPEYSEDLISIAEYNGKPAVAVGGPYYPSKKAEIFYSKQNPFSEISRRKRLLSTNEMREHFSYLEKNLAEEIIVTNSNMIAGMCEDLSI